jgi:NAD(P)-dependent dehydrogenase (short-subunit alcohol dehydrogenase family)
MNRVALVTGASRGIGRGIAVALAREGFDVAVNFVSDAAAAADAARACRAAARAARRRVRAVSCRADVSDAAGRRRLLAFVRRTFRRLDLLVNNAGIAPAVRADLLDADEASFDRLIAVNLKGPYFLTRDAARWMVENVRAGLHRDAPPRIVTVSSISARAASVNRGDYCVSKAGLSMMTALFAARLAEHGIGVYEIRPGLIATDMTAPVKAKYDELIAGGLLPLARWGTPEDVGRAVAAVARGDLPYSTGEVIHVDGGFHLWRL